MRDKFLICTIKAKFHYASCFEPDSVMEFGFEPVCDQLRTSFEPASVMEFGFNQILIFHLNLSLSHYGKM